MLERWVNHPEIRGQNGLMKNVEPITGDLICENKISKKGEQRNQEKEIIKDIIQNISHNSGVCILKWKVHQILAQRLKIDPH